MTSILKVDTIQDQAGNNIINESSDTITIGASGDTINIVGTLQNGGTNFLQGITMADQWRLTASINGTNGDITANLERNDSPSYGSIGTGMTESSGIFSFPSTGIYLVTVSAYFNSTSGVVDYMGVGTTVTINNSSYSTVNQNYNNANATDQYGGVFIADIIDVTDTANVKVKFNVSTENVNFRLLGATDNNATSFTFIRLGDT
jgi:hypothetical protein